MIISSQKWDVFTAQRSYASAVLRVVILSVCQSVRMSVTREPTGDIFIPHERASLLVFYCQRSRPNSNGITPTWAL